MKLPKLGVWAATDGLPAVDAAALAKRTEAWGYGAFWIPEATGREAFSASAWLLANTTKLIVATGIARRWPAPTLVRSRRPRCPRLWKRLGFVDADMAGGGSDRLIDSVVVWGDEKVIRARLEAHWQAGADHVCVQAISQTRFPDERLLELLAPR